jgi:hypothetical protein
VALVIDWLVCMVTSVVIFRTQFWTLAIFARGTYLLPRWPG